MKRLKTIQIGANLYSLFSDEIKSARFRGYYTDASLWDKLKKYARSAGMKVVYPALLLQYMMKSEQIPVKVKLILSASLGYFILPVDFIPDFVPLIGFTDDLGVLLLVLKQMAKYITPDIKSQSRNHLQKWFGINNNKQLDLIDQEYSGL